MKRNYNMLFLYAIAAALAIFVLYSVFYKTEGFVGAAAATPPPVVNYPTEAVIPRINQTQIEDAKNGVKALIAGRPDMVDAARQVLTDPGIAPTVHELLAPESGNDRQFVKACGCQPENDCDCN